MYQKLLFTTVSAIVLSINQNAIALSLEDFTDNDSIKWAEGKWEGEDDGLYHGTIEVKTSPDETQYFNYTYIKPKGYETVTGNNNRIGQKMDNVNVNKKLFKNISGGTYTYMSRAYYYGGGVIANWQNESSNVNIVADFIGNNSKSDGGFTFVFGGAIYNYNDYNNFKIGSISGNFIDNSAISNNGASGGAIASSGRIIIGNIAGDFIGNSAQGSSYVSGGAIDNNGTIGNDTMGIKGNFTDNKAFSSSSNAEGGAIYNSGTITSIDGDFIDNSAQGSSNAEGGAIYNGYNGTIGNETMGIKGNFTDNKAISSSSYARGGAIYNNDSIYKILNSSFKNNYVSGNTQSKGGAIYSTKDMTIVADNGISEFSGNYVHINPIEATEDTPAVEEQTIPNAIYMNRSVFLSKGQTLADVTPDQIVKLNLVAQNNGQIIFNDEIDGGIVVRGYGPSSSWADTELGVLNYNLNIDGDSTGTVTFNNHIRNADITLSNTNMIVDKAEYLGDNDNLTIKSGNLTINSGEMTIKQLGMNTLNFKSLAMPGGLLRVDSLTVDLANQTSGMITADEVSGGAGKIKVENVLLTSDGQAGSTPVQFVSEDISKEVTTDVTEALAPIYKYGVEYNNGSGEFVFTRGDLVEPEPEPDTPVDPDTPENPGTPSVPVTPIRPITPAYKAFNPGVFANDVFAMSAMNTQGEVAKQVFDMDTNREYCNGRIWATPYYSDDTLSYSGFYDVDSKNYGLIAGIDTRAFGDYDGWNSVYTLFGAYNDGESKYQGVKVDSKSWLVGLKASVYNGGFYGDAIVNYAWHDSDQKTAFGTDSVDSTGYGAALKAGYKHGFDKVELDTSAMLSWQTIEGDDFTSKSGARISTDDYSRLTLTPQVKLGYSFEKVKPYALVRYNFVLDEDGSSTVNNIALPTIESKDYVEYGLGLETTDTFPHSGFAHVLRHDGGRDGWSVTAGYKYNF